MITASHTETSPYAEYLREAHKARRARAEAAARKVANANQKAIASPVIEIDRARFLKPQPSFDYHVGLWQAWKVDQTKIIEQHIQRRCAEFGISRKDISKAGRDAYRVRAKDTIIYEIRETVKPSASWSEIGRHLNLDHSSVIAAHRRAAAANGDQEAIDRLKRIREAQSARTKEQRAQKARGT